MLLDTKDHMWCDSIYTHVLQDEFLSNMDGIGNGTKSPGGVVAVTVGVRTFCDIHTLMESPHDTLSECVPIIQGCVTA